MVYHIRYNGVIFGCKPVIGRSWGNTLPTWMQNHQKLRYNGHILWICFGNIAASWNDLKRGWLGNSRTKWKFIAEKIIEIDASDFPLPRLITRGHGLGDVRACREATFRIFWWRLRFRSWMATRVWLEGLGLIQQESSAVKITKSEGKIYWKPETLTKYGA